MREDELIEWLLEGDPAIRWQVRRDLLGAGQRAVATERAQVARAGWGRRLLRLQAADGRWVPARGPSRFRGLYIPKWTSTTYTMLLLARLGLPGDNPQARLGCQALVQGAEWFPSGGLGFFAARRTAEHCVSAMVLTVLEAFGADAAARASLERFLLDAQLPDGGWNCIEGAAHSSFNTTTAVLEALLPRSGSRQVADALARGREFLLAHRLYRSHRTGRLVKSSFTRRAGPSGGRLTSCASSIISPRPTRRAMRGSRKRSTGSSGNGEPAGDGGVRIPSPGHCTSNWSVPANPAAG